MQPAKLHIPKVAVFILLATGQLALVLAPVASGETTSQGSELVYMHHRFYDPVLGRFIGPDEVIPQESEYTNSYSYSFNNPTTYSDPSGLFPEDVHYAKTIINNILYLDALESFTPPDSESTPRLGLSSEWRDIYNHQVALLEHVLNLESNNISPEVIEDVKIQYDHISYLAWDLYREDPNSSGANIFVYVRQEGRDNSPPPFDIDKPQKPKSPRGGGPNNNLQDLGKYDPSTDAQQKPSKNGNGSRPYVGPSDLHPYEPGGGRGIRNYLRGGIAGIVITVAVDSLVNPDTTSADTHTLDPLTYDNALARLSGHSPVLPPYLFPPNDPLGEAQCYGQVHAAC